MESLIHVLDGFSVALQPINLFYAFIGCFVGTVVGILPGIGPGATIALLIPLSFGMEHTSALIMMCGIYYGAMYGCSTSAILINTPGDPTAVMTTLDGYQMAKKGRAGAALAIAAIGSFLAGSVSIVLLTFLAMPLTSLALRFGPAEYFNLMLFAMTAITSLTGKSFAKGMISTLLGLMIATIGIDVQSGQSRFTARVLEFQEGISFIVVVVGLFAIGEVFTRIEDLYKGMLKPMRIKGKVWLTSEEWSRSVRSIFRGGLYGFFIGVLPGAGGTIASILSYTAEKKASKYPEQFGTGAIEGVAAPESANNASVAGAMVPLLTLGIAGSGTTAVMLGVFIMYGIQPGPLLFQNDPALVWGLINSMYIGNLMLLLLNLPLIGIFVRIMYIPARVLLPLILCLSTIGIYSLNSSVFDLYVLLGFGVLGYIFRKLDIPTAPLVLSLVLGRLMEESFRQAMTISELNPVIFVHSPICILLLFMAFLSVALPHLMPRLKKIKKQVAEED